MLDEMERVLRGWGAWSNEAPHGGIVPPKMSDDGARRPSRAQLSDEQAKMVDRVLAILKSDSPEVFNILRLTYLKDMPQRSVAASLDITHAAVKDALRTGKAFLWGGLAGCCLGVELSEQ